LKPTVDNLNERHVKGLGGFQPKNANSFLDDVKIHRAQRKQGIKPYQDPSFEQQLANEKKFNREVKHPFSVDDFVYVDNKTSSFDKSYDTQISIFIS